MRVMTSGRCPGRLRSVGTAAAACLAVLAFAGACGATVVDGLAAHRGDFVPGVRVYALPRPDFDPRGASVPVSGPTDESGRFSMDLPPGKYYLVAFGKGEGKGSGFEPGDWYCFYSGNPVRVAGTPVHVGFNLVKVPDDGRVTDGFGGVQGTMLFDGEPLGRAYLYLYRDAADEFRGMGFYVAPVGPDGRFRAKLPPGTYYLIGRQRQEGGMYGPLKKNDKVGFYYGNPVTVAPGKTLAVSLEVISRVEMLEEIWFEKEAVGAFTVEGTIRDRGGQPLGGVFVLLYGEPETSGKPRYISSRTGSDGTFRVDVYDQGRYYLVARESLGGPAGEGEWYGRHEGKDGRALPVDLGSRTPAARVDLRVGRAGAGTP